ncbi:hypothetical protein GJ496_002781 [Pomphorhynchus laevis]|nr:hypothetical protein GJ496_002781 [Pomphorhynchus laevis]
MLPKLVRLSLLFMLMIQANIHLCRPFDWKTFKLNVTTDEPEEQLNEHLAVKVAANYYPNVPEKFLRDNTRELIRRFQLKTIFDFIDSYITVTASIENENKQTSLTVNTL